VKKQRQVASFSYIYFS
jgi:hypothetical protein